MPSIVTCEWYRRHWGTRVPALRKVMRTGIDAPWRSQSRFCRSLMYRRGKIPTMTRRIWLAIASTLAVAGACAGLILAGVPSSSAATAHRSSSHRVLPKWLHVMPATQADKRAFGVHGTCVIIYGGGGHHSPVKGVGVIAGGNGDEALLPG